MSVGSEFQRVGGSNREGTSPPGLVLGLGNGEKIGVGGTEAVGRGVRVMEIRELGRDLVM